MILMISRIILNNYSCFSLWIVLQAGGPLTKWIEHKTLCSLKEPDSIHGTIRLFPGTNQRKISPSLQTKTTSHSWEILVSQAQPTTWGGNQALRCLARMCNLRSSEGSLGMWNDKQQHPEEAADQKRTCLTKSYWYSYSGRNGSAGPSTRSNSVSSKWNTKCKVQEHVFHMWEVGPCNNQMPLSANDLL